MFNVKTPLFEVPDNFWTLRIGCAVESGWVGWAGGILLVNPSQQTCWQRASLFSLCAGMPSPVRGAWLSVQQPLLTGQGLRFVGLRAEEGQRPEGLAGLVLPGSATVCPQNC